MKNVINALDKQDAYNQAVRLKAYYPFRIVGIVDMQGKWGYLSGKTKHKFNALAKQGCHVYIISYT